MNDACVIEVSGRQAGLVVPQESGDFRFLASVREAFSLEGQVFRSAAHAGVAVRSAFAAAGVR
jgi:hypothetical protein